MESLDIGTDAIFTLVSCSFHEWAELPHPHFFIFFYLLFPDGKLFLFLLAA